MNIIKLQNAVVGAELQAPVRATVCETNSMLAGCNVHWIFRGSMIDLETGMHGVRHAITRIMRANRADCAERAMTADDIIIAIRACNGGDKYPDQTIRDNLCTVLADEVTSIQLSNEADSNRNASIYRAMRRSNGLNEICKRPRAAYYLVVQ